MKGVIDIRLLLQFAAVADCLSFTQAAVRLGLGQPRLSAQIRKLEGLLGFALFERSTRKVELTTRGQELLAIVKPLAATATTVREQVAMLREEAESRVRIGCPLLGAPDPKQAQLFSRFGRDNPAMSLDVQPGLSRHHAEQLRDHELDLALMSVLPDGPDWEFVPLHRLALAAVMDRSDLLAGTEADQPLQPELFAGRRIAVFYRRSAPDLFSQVYSGLEAVGAQLVEVPELRRSLLRDRPGLILSTIVAAPAGGDLPYGLVRREIAIPVPLRMMLVRSRNRVHSRAAERFWKMAADA